MTLKFLTLLSACTYVPFDAPRTITMASDPTGSVKAEVFRRTGNDPHKVIVVPLVDGNDALGARLRMIESAQRSIDLKTFLIKPDYAGALVWLALFSAAERGVRVRLLFDDVFTTASDEDIATLNSHPNVQIRTFNPLSRNSTLVGNFLLDFGRVNRRMHNKALVVDGATAIVGGRNIADEYYQINTSHEFADFDLFVGGRPVQQLSDAFDLFWNDKWALPLESLKDGDDTVLREALATFRDQADEVGADIYDRAINSQYLEDINAGRVEVSHAKARVVVDNPDKLRSPPGTGPFVVGEELYQTMNRATKEVLVITPYFVPQDYGATFFEKLVQRGIRVRIFTNSLASTNHAYVHGGYAPYRKRLVAAGVEIYEVRADAPALTGGFDSPLTLHSKLAVVDEKTVFAGSSNVDPRSIRQNSEIGMIFESSNLARQITDRIEGVEKNFTFKVEQTDDGKLQWVYDGSTGREIYNDEPGASAWSKIVATITGWLPVENQL
jgi:putative cardiolipin synthase